MSLHAIAVHLLKSTRRLAALRNPRPVARGYCGISVMRTATNKTNLFIRHSSEKEMEFVTHEAVKAGRSIGPFDYPNAFAFDPK